VKPKTSVILLMAYCAAATAQAVTIPTVLVGSPGNLADQRYLVSSRPEGVGAVSYSFRMGRGEVTNSQYAEFLNAVATDDVHSLYSPLMASQTFGGIIREGVPGSFSYSVKPPVVFPPGGPLPGTTYGYGDKPVVYVNWGDATRFANWLHNGQLTGAQNVDTTEDGAYPLNGVMSRSELNAVSRSANARWWIPSEDEWYKAAYHKNDGATSNYWEYPTRSDVPPNDNAPSADTGNSANYDLAAGHFFYPLTDVGSYALSVSSYGTYDQGGNVTEWNETRYPTKAQFPGFFHGARGGSAGDAAEHLRAWAGGSAEPTTEFAHMGFRVATVPEPATSGLITAAASLFFVRQRRRFGA